jgi:cobalt/nickel transport system permease protein
MRHPYLDRFSRIDSPIHRIPTHVKIVAVIVILLVIAATPLSYPIVFACAGVGLVSVAWLSRVPPRFLLRRMFLLELFVCGVAVLSLLQPGGLAVFARVLIKSTLCVATALLFSTTTPYVDLLQTLKSWKVPSLLITMLALMYRYMFVFFDELGRMQRARTSRTFVDKRMLVWHSLATIVAQLFIRSTERAERIYAAMCARGWR